MKPVNKLYIFKLNTRLTADIIYYDDFGKIETQKIYKVYDFRSNRYLGVQIFVNKETKMLLSHLNNDLSNLALKDITCYLVKGIECIECSTMCGTIWSIIRDSEL